VARRKPAAELLTTALASASDWSTPASSAFIAFIARSIALSCSSSGAAASASSRLSRAAIGASSPVSWLSPLCPTIAHKVQSRTVQVAQ
jgi:hypothetical protein